MSSPAGPRDQITRARLATYALGGLLFLVGTVVLIIAVVIAPDARTHNLRLAVSVLWVLLWIGLTAANLNARRLLNESSRLQELLTTLTEARRQVLRDEDPRQVVVQSVLEVARARVAVLFEPHDGALRVTASAGSDLPDLRIPLDQPSIAGRVFGSSQAVRVLDIHDEDGAHSVLKAVERLLGSRLHSISYVPVRAHGASQGVLCAAFDQIDERAADAAIPPLELLAAELSIAIEREQILAELHTLALTDVLTGIANRRAWQVGMQSLPRHGGMLLLDLDHFKRVNDTWGHDAGDEVLRAFAGVLRDTVREEDLCARIGGEEFAILLPDGEDPSPLVARIRANWAAVMTELELGTVTFSAGAAVRQPHESVSDLQRRCDRALYAAKQDGRNRLVFAAAL